MLLYFCVVKFQADENRLWGQNCELTETLHINAECQFVCEPSNFHLSFKLYMLTSLVKAFRRLVLAW